MAELNLELDDTILQDYRKSFGEHYEVISNCVTMLDKDPNDHDIVDEIFRSLHTIKGNANMCQLDVLTQFAHSIEDLVTAIRDQHLLYTHILGETIMLCLDKAKEIGECIFSQRPIDHDNIAKIENSLHTLRNGMQEEIPEYTDKIIAIISGHIVDTENKSVITNIAHTDNNHKPLFIDLTETKSNKVTTIESQPNWWTNYDSKTVELLSYLRDLAKHLEVKMPHWLGRFTRTLPLANALNNSLPTKADPIQLEVALYAHDLSQIYLPDSLLHKDSKYDQDDVAAIHGHPTLSAKMLSLIPGWADAANIVLQHHEKWDGSGYPNGLKEGNICIGAQIMSLVDAYESMTHPRPDRQYKRSILRAITEINNCSGSQFSPELTLVLNKVLKEQMIARKN